ncbi:hypothetical protein CNR22_23965 [Sphingobacteriaceae bacterium]|nr:hypothetical protein CNR22_23965 [Sphingobacteriaceae bacterium]
MKYLFSLCLLILVSCHSHKTAEKKSDIPACVQKAVENFKKNPCEKGLSVKEYTFQGKEVFVFGQDGCGNDMTSEVMDSNCKSLGLLGGFVGNVKINGEDFSNAVFVKTLWEK